MKRVLLTIAVLLGMTFGAFAQFGNRDDNGTYAPIVLPPHAQLEDQDASVNFITQTIALSAGWNWVSFNVEITLDDLKAAIVEVTQTGDRPIIKSQSNGTTRKNANNNNWMGQLRALDLSQMYQIQIGADCEITVSGMPINPADHPATITYGANWIAYPLSESMSVINAFSSFNAIKDDVVKSQSSGQAKKTASSWMGALKNLEPGNGYIYYSKSTETKTLIFSTGTK